MSARFNRIGLTPHAKALPLNYGPVLMHKNSLFFNKNDLNV